MEEKTPINSSEIYRMEPTLQFFEYKHLPPDLQAISLPFFHLSRQIVLELPRNPERSVALRKLLEAKDAAVRARLFKDNGPSGQGQAALELFKQGLVSKEDVCREIAETKNSTRETS